MKEYTLTRGGLGLDLVLLCTKKSADAILVTGNEPRIDTVEVSQSNKGLNGNPAGIRNDSANGDNGSTLTRSNIT